MASDSFNLMSKNQNIMDNDIFYDLFRIMDATYFIFIKLSSLPFNH